MLSQIIASIIVFSKTQVGNTCLGNDNGNYIFSFLSSQVIMQKIKFLSETQQRKIYAR